MRLLYLLALLYASVGACGTMNATAPKTTVVTLSGHTGYSGYPQVIYWITDSDPTSYPTSNSSVLQDLSFSAEIIETNGYSKTLSPQPGVFAMGVSGMNQGGTDISGSITVGNKSPNAHTLYLTIYACTSTSATKCFKFFSQQFSVAAAESCSGSINNATLPTTVANTTTTYEMPFSLTGLSSSRITITSNDMDSNGRLHLGGGRRCSDFHNPRSYLGENVATLVRAIDTSLVNFCGRLSRW